MADFIRSRWVLFLVLAVFIACKLPHLFYPYYWDESWPYAVAIRDLYNHGISLMPNAIDAEISRGHPLFFHALAACWMHVFGASHLAMHSFALCIAVCVLIAVFEVGLRLFDQRVAVISLVLVATQVVFFVQSSFVLFEILVALLAFISLYTYSTDKYLAAALALTALFLTKESGLIVGFVLGLDALRGLFNSKIDFKTRVLRCASIAVPCLIIAVYFVVQKQLRGWYIFPFYHDLIEHNWNAFWYKFRINCIREVFYTDLRFLLFLVLILLAPIATIKNKKLRYLAILIPTACIYYFIDDMRAGRLLPGIPFFIVFLCSVCYLLKVYSGADLFSDIRQRRFIRLAGLFTLCFLIFCPLNFFIPRYLLAALIPLLFLVAVFFDKLVSNSYRQLYYPLLAVILLIGLLSFKYNDGYGDTDMGAFGGMLVHQGVVDYLERNDCYDRNITCGQFLEQQHLTNPATGFLRSGKIFKHVRFDLDKQTDYIVFDAMEYDPRYDAVKIDTSFHRVYRLQRGKTWAEIYARK